MQSLILAPSSPPATDKITALLYAWASNSALVTPDLPVL